MADSERNRDVKLANRVSFLGSLITSTRNDINQQIKKPLTCKSTNVCYLVNCRKCGQQDTGEAKLEFHKRLNNHKIDIRQKN